jgi:hypothetical protein
MDFKQPPDLAPNEIYRGSRKVYLESEDDVTVIGTKWFSHLKRQLSFESAEAMPGMGGGGCQVVIDKVEKVNSAQNLGVTAYGVVDRDVLLGDPQQHTLWWEVDDAKFHAEKPYGESIHVLRCWELENLFLHPKAIAKVLRDKRLSAESPTGNDVAEELLAHLDTFWAISLLDVLSVPCRNPSPAIGYGGQDAGEKLEKSVCEYTNTSQADFNTQKNKMQCFDDPSLSSVERWERLSRILDGKRVLARLRQIFNEEFSRPMSERGALAGAILDLGLIDSELTNFLQVAAKGGSR